MKLVVVLELALALWLTVAQVHTSVPEPNTCKSSCEKHLALSLVIFWILGGSREILDGASQSL
jgi:hypothetical protein